MLMVVGRCKRVRTRTVPYTDKKTGEDTSFVETTVAIATEEDVNASWCVVSRDFGPVEEGELVAAEASVRTFPSSQSRTGAGYQITLWRRVALADVMPDASRADDGAPHRLAAVN